MSDALLQPIRCVFPFRELTLMNQFSTHLLSTMPSVLPLEEDWPKLVHQHITTTNKIVGSIDTFMELEKINRKIMRGNPKKSENFLVDQRNKFAINSIPLYTKFDSFCVLLWGSIASLMNELVYVFSLEIPESKRYVSNILRELTRDDALKDSTLTKFLKNESEQWWFQYLNKIRNQIEHGLIFPMCYEAKKIILPDNPKLPITNATFTKNLELIETCKTLLNRTVDVLEISYGQIDRFLYDRR